MNSLDDPKLQAVLDRLHKAARGDVKFFLTNIPLMTRMLLGREAPPPAEQSRLFKDVYIPISRDAGSLPVSGGAQPRREADRRVRHLLRHLDALRRGGGARRGRPGDRLGARAEQAAGRDRAPGRGRARELRRGQARRRARDAARRGGADRSRCSSTAGRSCTCRCSRCSRPKLRPGRGRARRQHQDLPPRARALRRLCAERTQQFAIRDASARGRLRVLACLGSAEPAANSALLASLRSDGPRPPPGAGGTPLPRRSLALAVLLLCLGGVALAEHEARGRAARRADPALGPRRPARRTSRPRCSAASRSAHATQRAARRPRT